MKNSTSIKRLSFCIMTCLYWYATYTYVSYLSYYGRNLGGTSTLVGIMIGSYGFAQLLLRIPIGILSDKLHNRRLFIRLGCFFAMFSAICFYFSRNIYHLIFSRILSGFAASAWVSITVLYNSYSAPNQSAQAMASISGWNLCGQLLGSSTALFAVERFGVRSLFVFAAIGGFISFIMSLFIDESDTDKKPLTFSELLSVGKTRWVLACSTIGMITQLLCYATVTGFTPDIASSLGASSEQLSLIMLITTFSGIVFSFAGEKLLIKKPSLYYYVMLSLVAMSITTVLQVYASSLALLYTAVAIFGFFRGASMSLLMTLVIKPFSKDHQAASMGFYQAFYSLGIICGPTIVGSINDTYGMRPAFIICACIGVASIIFCAVTLNDKKLKKAIDKEHM